MIHIINSNIHQMNIKDQFFTNQKENIDPQNDQLTPVLHFSNMNCERKPLRDITHAYV